jgi:hypothetical protein
MRPKGLSDATVERGKTVAPSASAPGGVAIRAAFWLDPGVDRARIRHDDDLRLWLALGDGRMLAFRLHGVRARDDRLLAPLVAAIADDLRGECFRLEIPGCTVQVLYAAPVLPFPDAVSTPPELRPEWLALAGTIDGVVLDFLESIATPGYAGGFLASVRNYNRLAMLDSGRRERRLQALTRFPALVVPVLLTRHHSPNLYDGKRHAWRHPDPQVEEAIDRGRDLTGALAEHYGISRALVRAPLNASWWPMDQDTRRDTLAVIDCLPPQRRPRSAEVFERHATAWSAYLLLTGVGEKPPSRPLDRAVHVGAFRDGVSETFERLARLERVPGHAIADARDFLAAAACLADAWIRGTPIVMIEELAEAWLACHGLVRLVEDSARWHRAVARVRPAVPEGVASHSVPSVLDRFERGPACATEITTYAALVAEGASMRHCVASYWAEIVAGDRIFHLESVWDGEQPARATACYALEVRNGNPRYRLAQLRGPCNEAVSASMADFARALEAELNAPSCERARLAVLALREPFRNQERPVPRDPPHEGMRLDAALERRLLRALAWLGLNPAPAERLLLAPVAGLEFHDGLSCLGALRCGDPVELVRERGNRFDRNAVRIDWRGSTLGYLPRRTNRDVAARLDAGSELAGRIVRIKSHGASWRRVFIEILDARAPQAAGTGPLG